MSESESGEIHFNPPGKDDERMQLVGAEREFKGSIGQHDLAHFDKLYRRNKQDTLEKEYIRFAAKKLEELDDLKKRGKISEWTYGINELEIKGLGYVTEAIPAESADEQAIAVIALLAGNSREKNHPQTKEHHTFYKDKLFESDASQYFIDKEGEVHYSFMGARNFHSLAVRGLHIVRRATADRESSKLTYLIDQYNGIAHPGVNKRTEIALGLLEVATVLGVSYSKERVLSDHLGEILVQEFLKERNPSATLLEKMGAEGLTENAKRWLKAEYFNPYCLGEINDFVWNSAGSSNYFDLLKRKDLQENRVINGGYEVVSPTFVQQWHQQIDSPRGLRFLIRDRADKETGMGQGAIMRYDLDEPQAYFQDKAKHDEQLALLGMGIDVKKRTLLYSADGLKGQLTKFIAEESLFQTIPLSDNMKEYNSELRLLFKALVADQSMPDKMRASLKQFIKSNAQISYDLIKDNPLLRWIGYLPEGVQGYLALVETTDRTAQEGLYIAMKATAAEFTRTLFKQTDESNYVFGTNIPNSRIPKEIDRVINALKEEKQTVARRSFREPVQVASYYDTSMRDFQVQGSLHGVRSNLRRETSREAPLAVILQQSGQDLADLSDVLYTELIKDGRVSALKTSARKTGKALVKGTVIAGVGLGLGILGAEGLVALFPISSHAQTSEQPTATPAPSLLEHWNLHPRPEQKTVVPNPNGQAEMPASPISKKKADSDMTSIEDPTGNPIVAAEVLHLPDKLHGHYGGFIPFGYDLQDRNGALEGKLNFDKTVDNVTVVPLDKDMPVSFGSEDIALSFKPREFIYLPDNVDVTRIIQHGGTAPHRNALGALQFDVNHLPEQLVIVGTVQERQQAVPGSKMRILGQDSSLNYAPVVDVASAKLLSDTLKTDPELHSLLATVANEPTHALTQTTELQTLWQQMYGLEQVMNHRYYSLKLTKEPEPGSYSGITYLDTYGGFYCNTAGIITAQFAQLNGMPSFLRGGAIFSVNEKNELKNEGIYHQEPLFIGPGGFIIVHDNTPSPIRSPDRDDDRRAQPTARPMEEQDPVQVRGIIFEALQDAKEKQALEDKKAAEEAQRKIAEAQEAAAKASEELKRKQMWEGIENTARKAAAPEYVIAALLLAAGALYAHPKSRKFIREGIEESISRSRYELRQYRLNQVKKRLENAEEVSFSVEKPSPEQQVTEESLVENAVPVVEQTEQPLIREDVPTPAKENTPLPVHQSAENTEIQTNTEPETNVAESEMIMLLAGGLGIELATDPDSEEEFSKRLQNVVHSIANLTTADLASLQELAISRLNGNTVDVPDSLIPLVEMVDLRRWVETVLENEEKLRLPYSVRSRGEARHNRVMRLLNTAINSAPEDSVGKVALNLVKNTFK